MNDCGPRKLVNAQKAIVLVAGMQAGIVYDTEQRGEHFKVV